MIESADNMGVLKLYNDITHTRAFMYNTIVKKYADGTEKISYKSYSTLKGMQTKKGESNLSENLKEYQKYKNLYKTKQNIIDLAYHNGVGEPWEYFVTLTFDDQKVNAKNYEEVSKMLQKWINNMKHQNPKMQYIIAPEPHKSGRIHFHGIFKNVPNWQLEEARSPHTNRLIKKNGLQIFNLTNYKYGFTTVSKVTDLEAISVYISKYITKDLIDLAYKKRYWASKSLNKPKVEYAYFDEETLLFHISKATHVKDIKRDNSRSIFITTKFT